MIIPNFEYGVNSIHLDMDGVLADFDKYVLENMGRTFNHQTGPADQEMWDFLASVPNVYYKLPLTPYARRLYEAAKTVSGGKVKILTAIPRRTTMPTAEQDKRDWVRDYLDPELHVAIGPFSKDKWRHCVPGDILIDDREDNIKSWREQGFGIGILHSGDIEATLEELLLYT